MRRLPGPGGRPALERGSDPRRLLHRWDPESQTLRSHFLASSGEILEYIHQLAGDTLTIWFGDLESPAKFVGTFDAEGNRTTGGWDWPGGGYESNMTRVEETGRSHT